MIDILRRKRRNVGTARKISFSHRCTIDCASLIYLDLNLSGVLGGSCNTYLRAGYLSAIARQAPRGHACAGQRQVTSTCPEEADSFHDGSGLDSSKARHSRFPEEGRCGPGEAGKATPPRHGGAA